MDFKMGELVMTRGINDKIADSLKFANEITSALQRYVKCDWGELCEADKKMNDLAVKNNDDRILAAYKTEEGKVYIITEWNRAVTTILFAHEY